MRCAVTGGAGFIGSHLVDRLIKEGHKVGVLDNRRTQYINPKANFNKGDINDNWSLEGIDYVFHLAAMAKVRESVRDPLPSNQANVDGTLNFLIKAKEAKVKKFIFASSCSVYGDEPNACREDMMVDPINPYGLQKVIGEQYCKLFADLYGLPYIALRFFNVYGERMEGSSEDSLLIGKGIESLKTGESLPIYGKGDRTRDFTWVHDIVDGCIKAMELPVKNEIINLCTGKSTTVLDVVKLIGCKYHHTQPRKGERKYYLGDNTKAQKLLNWKPKISIEEGIKKLKEG